MGVLSLGQRLVVEADDAGDLPYSILVLPEVNELGLADRAGVLVSRVMETVDADLDRAVVGDRVDLERPGDEFSGDFAADVVLDPFDESWASAAQSGLVVIELQVVGQERSEFLQITVVVGVEKLGVQGLDRFEERVGGWGLSVDVSDWCSQQSCDEGGLHKSSGPFHSGIPFMRGMRT